MKSVCSFLCGACGLNHRAYLPNIFNVKILRQAYSLACTTFTFVYTLFSHRFVVCVHFVFVLFHCAQRRNIFRSSRFSSSSFPFSLLTSFVLFQFQFDFELIFSAIQFHIYFTSIFSLNEIVFQYFSSCFPWMWLWRASSC